MIVLLEWTVKDSSGKTVWIKAVQGSSTHYEGNLMTYKKNLKRIVEDPVKDLAEKSVSEMTSAPELRKLSE